MLDVPNSKESTMLINYACVKSSSFDLDELNCWNKNLDVDLNLFLHKTCLLAEIICYLTKYISHIWSISLLTFDRLVGI